MSELPSSLAARVATAKACTSDTSRDAIQSSKQFALVWRLFVEDYGSGDVRDLPGIAIRWADSDFVFWNCVTLTEVSVNSRLLAERLEQVSDYMRSKSRPGFLWLFENFLDGDARAGLPAAAERAGLRFSMPAFGMAGDILPIPEPSHPNLRFVRVTTEDQLAAYADLNCLAYGMPLEHGRDGLCGSTLWKGHPGLGAQRG